MNYFKLQTLKSHLAEGNEKNQKLIDTKLKRKVTFGDEDGLSDEGRGRKGGDGGMSDSSEFNDDVKKQQGEMSDSDSEPAPVVPIKSKDGSTALKSALTSKNKPTKPILKLGEKTREDKVRALAAAFGHQEYDEDKKQWKFGTKGRSILDQSDPESRKQLWAAFNIQRAYRYINKQN